MRDIVTKSRRVARTTHKHKWQEIRTWGGNRTKGNNQFRYGEMGNKLDRFHVATTRENYVNDQN
jgi:hypothetical protein